MPNPKSSNIDPWLNFSFDSDQGTLWPNEYGRKYGLPSASEQGNANANSFLDPNGLVSGFYNDVMGYTSQSREFAQQEYLMDKENAYNDPRAQMARMIAAGISPAAAAAAITGGQNVSAQAPSVASATPSAAAADAASAMVGGFAGAAADYASAATSNATRNATLGNILADTENKVAATGLSKEQSRAYGISNMFLSEKEQLNLQTLQKNLEVMDGQRDLFKAQIGHYDTLNKNLEQQIELFKAQGNLADMQALVEQKRSLLIEQQTFALQWQKAIRDMYHIDPSMPIENNSFLMWLQGDDNYKASLGVVNDINYYRYKGQYTAESESAYSIAYRRKNGENAADVVNGSVGGPVGFLNRLLNVGVAILNGAMAQFNKSADVAHNWIVGKIKEGKYNSVRNVLQDQLEEFRRIDNPPAEIQQAMFDLEQVLQLSNSEFYDYFVKRK